MPAIVRTKAHRALVSVLVASRKEAGLTQEELADRCGKPQSFIASIESGQRGVQVAELGILAKGLGVPQLKLFKRYLHWLSS